VALFLAAWLGNGVTTQLTKYFVFQGSDDLFFNRTTFSSQNLRIYAHWHAAAHCYPWSHARNAKWNRTSLSPCGACDALRRYTACYPVEAGALHSLQEQLLSDVGIFRRTNMRGHITTSALVLDVTRHQALLIHPLVYDVWLQPGGHYELPGSLWQSACREVAEETGLRAVRPFL